MANISRRKNNNASISTKDLKKAIVERNNKLKKQNDKISLIVIDKEKELKSLDKEYSSKSKNLGVLIKDIEFQEERIQKLKGGVYSNERLLNEKLKKVGEAESKAFDYESSVEKLEEREQKLLDQISKLEFYKAKCSDSKVELSGIQAKKDNALSELNKVEDEIANTVDEASKKISYYEDQYDGLEEKAKKHEDMVHQFEQRLFETEDQFKKEENKLKDFIAKAELSLIHISEPTRPY